MKPRWFFLGQKCTICKIVLSNSKILRLRGFPFRETGQSSAWSFLVSSFSLAKATARDEVVATPPTRRESRDKNDSRGGAAEARSLREK